MVGRRRIFPLFVLLFSTVLWPNGAAAGPSLPPAPYKPLPVGTVLNYGSWKCEVEAVDGMDMTCRSGDKRVQIFAGFILHGTPDKSEYGGIIETLPDKWDVQVESYTMDKASRDRASSIWPLSLGKSAKVQIGYNALLGFSGRSIPGTVDLEIKVADAAPITVLGRNYDAYRIEVRETFSKNRITRRMHWYAPELGVVVKSNFAWIAGEYTGFNGYSYTLERLHLPGGPGAAMASLRSPPVAPSSPPAGVQVATQALEPNESVFELAFWNTIKDSKSADDYKAYLEQFPKGRFAALAQVRSRSPAPVAKRETAAPQRQAPPKPDPFADIYFGKYTALVIGNNQYSHLNNLKTAINDAKSVAESLRRDYGFNVELLTNATRGDILRALARLRARLKFDDNLLIYYAGHGLLDEVGLQGYWLPVDAEDGIPTNWISTSDITVTLRAIRAKHVMVVADSCYSGTLVRAGANAPKTAKSKHAWIKRVLTKRTRVALVSGGLEPVADSGGVGSHSVFASAFLSALADNDGVIDGQTLFDRVKRPVVLNADQTPQYSDIRRAGHEGGDFLFVRRR